MTEYQEKILKEKLDLVTKLNSLSQYKFKLETRTDDPEYSAIKMEGFPISVTYWDYKKNYSFHISETILYVKWNSQKEIEEGLKRPQNVGVLTKSKIKAWVEFLKEVYKQMVKLSEERQRVVNSFITDMKTNGAIFSKSSEYSEQNGTYSGYIVKNGLQFEFEVHDEGYISKKIEVHYGVNNSLENFLLIADNKYKAD